jgi:subtilisin family serine protease
VRRCALFITTVIAFAVATMSTATAAVDPVGPKAAAADQTWVVTLVGHADAPREAPQLAGRQGGRVLAVYSHVLNGFAFSGSAAAAAALARDPQVAHVEASRTLHAVEVAPNGILRTSAWAAHQAGYTGVTSGGTPVRVAVVDTGIKADHVDLAANIAPGLGINCINPGQPPTDDQGHGTHVAGTVAAAFNGQGVVGMATNAQLIPVKVLDSTGFGTDAQVICGLDYIAALAQSQPGPYVVNMSLGDPNRPGETTCGSSALHQAICGLTNAGVTVVAAAGNDGGDAASFVPASYDEVIAVSAYTDFDGRSGGAVGCQADFSDYGFECDDTLASFSNYGSVVDVTAPGVHVLSDSLDGGQATLSGTSMATPHVAGAAALVLGVNPGLTPAQVRGLLESTGECPDGSVANAPTCAGHGQWQVGGLFGTSPDKDGIPEPLVNALRAAQAAGNAPPPPVDTQPDFSLSISPASLTVAQGTNGSTTVNTTAINAPEPVALAVTGLPSGATATLNPTIVNSGSSSTLTINTGTAAAGTYTLTVTGSAASGAHTATVTLMISPPPLYTSAPQGSWVNTYGSQGYVLAGWNGGGSDLTSLGAATVSLDHGSRWCWNCSTSDVRALQNPGQTQRRAATYYDPNQVVVHLSFPSAYSGTLHLYAIDWDSTDRRESITVNDGSGPHTVNITTDFSQGAWTSVPVTVAAGGTVTITVTRTAGINAVLSGIFLD